jgi:hypothetical protein
MRLLRMLPLLHLLLVVASSSSPGARQTPSATPAVTVFEGARLLTGDGTKGS